MKTVGDKLEAFSVVGVKPGFKCREENGVSAYETITASSFPGKWKVIYFYSKDFSLLCPTEIIAFEEIASEFEKRDAVLMGGSTDSEHCKLAMRRAYPEMENLSHYSFADTTGSLVDQLGVRDEEGVAMRATFIIDPDNEIRFVSVNAHRVCRSTHEVLRVLDALQTEAPCACNREIGGETF
ncbi:redoxin domain-containing protein [Basilea psittacipulmonis]|uniref:Alkyl hydroperoxide reductase C n=1 Tax=Basilea psittacipulmonis DSM 24701 TaxID=1072685 RepID=A0A077DEC2_9BURK|nr:redoxin domain-containing protein [Basilea psittacipulmonis]AIL33190.1 alkyl hydroperoxide reductase [Basilea psittacipulmonis DSM 24701]